MFSKLDGIHDCKWYHSNGKLEDFKSCSLKVQCETEATQTQNYIG